jgi:hypothetical protein
MNMDEHKNIVKEGIAPLAESLTLTLFVFLVFIRGSSMRRENHMGG